MNNKKIVLPFLIGALVVTSAWGTDSASDSQLGGTSTDRTDISLEIEGGEKGSIIISGLKETINFGSFGSNLISGADLVETSDFCVYRTGAGTGAIDYNLRLENTATGDSEAFYLKVSDDSDSTGTPVRFTGKHFSRATLAATNSNESGTPFRYDGENMPVSSTQNGRLDGESGSYSCSGDNASIELTIAFNDAAKAIAGSYRSQLILTVEPR